MNIFKKAVLFLSLAFLAPAYASAQVTVYAEGAYTDTDLVVYIYADIDAASTDEALLSYGVTLKYNTTDLGTPVVEKNASDWYFGDKSDPYATPNAEPDTSTPGQVIIIGGKLDSAAPLEGVSGDRVILATVSFVRSSTNVPSAELYLGKGGTYANFVQIDGTDLDKTLSGTEDESGSIGQVDIFQRGDADGDGYITTSDMFKVKGAMATKIYKCYVDCDGDGYITTSDMFCIKGKM